MLRDAPWPPLPDAPSYRRVKADALGNAFDAILLNQTTASKDNISDIWGATDTEDALALSGVVERRLNDCIVSASASVLGVPAVHPIQLEACFCLLHPHRPNSLMVVNWTGGGKTHILCTLWIIKRVIILMFIPLLTPSADVMHKFELPNPKWESIGIYLLNVIFHFNCLAYQKLIHHC
jgi:hypothetical protein